MPLSKLLLKTTKKMSLDEKSRHEKNTHPPKIMEVEMGPSNNWVPLNSGNFPLPQLWKNV